jgi:hypothetical protein
MAGLKDVIASSVGKIAPLLGSVLGSPLAGVGISLLAQMFGLHPDNLAGIAEKVADPANEITIKRLEADHLETLAKVGAGNYAVEVEDRKNAREHAVCYKDFLRHLALMVTIGFFGTLALLFLPITIPVDEKNLLAMLVGMLASKWQTIIDFFYGSSRPQTNQGGLKS